MHPQKPVHINLSAAERAKRAESVLNSKLGNSHTLTHTHTQYTYAYIYVNVSQARQNAAKNYGFSTIDNKALYNL